MRGSRFAPRERRIVDPPDRDLLTATTSARARRRLRRTGGRHPRDLQAGLRPSRGRRVLRPRRDDLESRLRRRRTDIPLVLRAAPSLLVPDADEALRARARRLLARDVGACAWPCSAAAA